MVYEWSEGQSIKNNSRKHRDDECNVVSGVQYAQFSSQDCVLEVPVHGISSTCCSRPYPYVGNYCFWGD